MELTTGKYLENLDDIKMADIISPLIEKGYKIEQIETSGNTITGITLDNSSNDAK